MEKTIKAPQDTRDAYKLLTESERVQVFDIRLNPGEKAAMHAHTEHVMHVLSNQKVRFTLGDGQTKEHELEAGQVMLVPEGAEAIENIGAGAAHSVVVELKEEVKVDRAGQTYTAGLWQVKAGKENEFIAAWEEFAEWTTAYQSGAIEGMLLQDVEQPQRFISFGPWEDTQSVQAWRQQPEFKAFVAKAKGLCDDIQPLTLKSVAHVLSRTSCILL